MNHPAVIEELERYIKLIEDKKLTLTYKVLMEMHRILCESRILILEKVNRPDVEEIMGNIQELKDDE